MTHQENFRSNAFLIDGNWRDAPPLARSHTLIDPVTEAPWATIAFADKREVDAAVAAARRAFVSFSRTSRTQRIALLERILDLYQGRVEEIGETISREIGAPLRFAIDVHATAGANHIKAALETLRSFTFEERRGDAVLMHDAIGVCALITPWNWPVNQIAPKVAYALAAGCTMVLKPSEYSPFSARVFAEIIQDAGVPAGVFNMLNGDGPGTGAILAAHPDVDMISITGSVRAGAAAAHAGADTIKRVVQELGGKSANIILPDADFEAVVTRGVNVCFANAGQSCAAPSRLLVPAERLAEAEAIAARAAEAHKSGAPSIPDVNLGPVVNRRQFDHVQGLIEFGVVEGARLVTGGPGRPDGLSAGYFIRPTVFSDVTEEMRIANEEIFGPVIVLMPYKDEDDAVRIANSTEFGLVAHVQGKSGARLHRIGRNLRAGRILFNYPGLDLISPFGGYRKSGNGREFGAFGLSEYLEVKVGLGLSRISDWRLDTGAPLNQKAQ